MMDPATLIDMLERCFGVIRAQVEGLGHADSLIQPPFRGNCLNWVLGHVVQSRNRMLILVDQPTIWTPEQVARYERDSAPILDGVEALPLEKMLADLATSQERLVSALQKMTAQDLEATGKEVIKGARPRSVGAWLHFLLWHETYHVGQMEYLRQLAGVNDKVI